MATTINADTEIGGAIITGDTSGSLSLQAAGNTLVTLSGGTVAVAAGLTADSASITGAVVAGSATLGGLLYPTSDGTANQAIVTNASGTLSFASVLLPSNNLSDVTSAATSRTNLGLVIGTDVQAYDSNLTDFVTTFTLPTADGTAAQLLSTDGAGNLAFVAAAGGGEAFSAF